MTVLGAPTELEGLVGHFEKLYVSTFDCATFYSLVLNNCKMGKGNVSESPDFAKLAHLFAAAFISEPS